MKRFSTYFISLLFSFPVFSQQQNDNSSIFITDTAKHVISHSTAFARTDNNGCKIYPYNKKRVRLVTAANIAGYGGTMAGLYSAWYSNYPQTRFHFFNDNAEWLQVDKVGHAYSAYVESYG